MNLYRCISFCDVFASESDVVLKHSDVLHLWRKVMLSLLITLSKTKHHFAETSLRSNITCLVANLVVETVQPFQHGLSSGTYQPV